MGKTIALLHTNGSSSNWEFYASGAERECRITPKDTSSTISVEEASFFLYDHLGNTRINYTPLKMNGIIGMRINSAVDYFPYGKVLREFYETADKERYLTTQHERDEYTGLDYRGARYYDSDVARFLSLDPHAKDYASWSAYNYVMGNPVLYLDPTGKAVETTFVDEYGNTIVKTDDGSDEIFVVKDVDEFIEELAVLVASELEEVEILNRVIGDNNGYHIDDIWAGRGVEDREDQGDYIVGYQCGYHGEVVDCGKVYFRDGRDAGQAIVGRSKGESDREAGYMNLLDPQPKNNAPMYSILKNEENTKVLKKNQGGTGGKLSQINKKSF